MTKYNGMNEGILKGKEETHAFLEIKPGKEPIIMEESKTLNVTYIESAKQAYKKKRGNIFPLCGLLLAFVFVIWLIGLTMVREFQLADLRREVQEIRDSIEEIKMHYADDQLFDELKEFEEEVKAEKQLPPIDDEIPTGKVESKLNKIFGIKYPDDDMIYDDEEDNIDYEYNDNDQKSEEDIDRADFLGEVMEAKRPDDINQEDDDTKAERNRRSFSEKTSAEIQVLGDSSATDRNQSDTRVYYHPTTVEPGFSKTSSGIEKFEDEPVYETVDPPGIRRPIIRRRINSDYENNEDHSIERRNRRHRKQKASQSALEVFENVDLITKKNLETKNLLVAQFHGDTSKHSIGKNYDGNGRLLHQHEVPYTAWAPARWLSPSGMDAHFPIQNGAVTVPESGVYFVYAQVYYHDQHDTSGFRVYRSNGIHDEGILHCVTMTHSKEAVDKINTCYTAGAFHLNSGDTIFVKNMGGMRYSLMQPGKSFFGLIKLNDVLGR